MSAQLTVDLAPKDVAKKVTEEEKSRRLGAPEEFTDDALARLDRTYRRMQEDGDASRATAAMRKRIRQVQLSRFALRMRYGATFAGTMVYDRHYRLDEPPSYQLAAMMDRELWRMGKRHVLAWADAEVSR